LFGPQCWRPKAFANYPDHRGGEASHPKGENAAERRDEDGHRNHLKDARGYYCIGLAPPRIPYDASLLCGLQGQTISVGSCDRLFMQLSDYSSTPSVRR
jgi:hypothetical protein